jgi:hypothetical protein
MPDMTPVKIHVVAVILVLWGVLDIWMGLIYGQPLGYIVAAVCFVASTALWMNKPWSRFVVYLLCALKIAGLISFAMQLVGYGWPYPRLDRTILTVMPGAILLLVAVWMIVVTRKFFTSNKEDPSAIGSQRFQNS